ncbi:2-dehydropantoate 2-reductase [Nocardiopsis sp. RSe5-2]|uniref:2-dehydropantoate 2-reductase n=1 Tax=Nocardiopsis endophytica TaxID=3018445 RepID=A0ABT4U6Y7_9ACTN|nr:2-dehydropantoate 2-reductase [Nocardiopsis endophytica]MDA2812709.1 2-dehydropantoate 2-reductase [Nocardiopsis endophytica]
MGPGGVGGLLAALLARAGERTRVLATEGTATRIADAGLSVGSPVYGDFTARPDAAQELAEPTDALFVTTKGTGLRDALDRVPAEHVHGALIVPLLNGFEHVEILRDRYPGARVLPAAIHVGASRDAPGAIRHTSPYNRMEIAGEGARALAEVLRNAGVQVDVVEDGDRVLWDKYAFLLPTALVCAHALMPIGRAREERRADMDAVLEEVVRVAAARGVPVDADAVRRTIAERPAHTRPSLLFDRETGRPMETDSLGGALIRAARSAGLEVPVAERLVADLLRDEADTA